MISPVRVPCGNPIAWPSLPLSALEQAVLLLNALIVFIIGPAQRRRTC